MNLPTQLAWSHSRLPSCSTKHKLSSFNLNISDHLSISIDIDIPIPILKEKRKISFRNLKSPSPSALLPLKCLPPLPHRLVIPLILSNYYNDTLSTCLDQLAPITSKIVSFTHLNSTK